MNISSTTEEDFECQLKEFFKTDNAVSKRGIVYFWNVSRPIPRVVGESKIIYIGQTSGSFKERYGAASTIKIEKEYFNRFYKKAIEEYGPISIEIIASEDPSVDEQKKLEKYFESHYEYPPINRVIPKNKL